MTLRFARRVAFAVLTALTSALPGYAADEIQVYNAEINDPGEFSLQLHGNYVIEGIRTPEFPGGTPAHHAFNGTPEFAYGLEDWWEIGAYIPYELSGDGHFKIGSVKLRSLFVSPHAADRNFFYGVNFELGYAKSTYAETHYNMEMRPMIGWREAPWEFIVNPILGMALSGPDQTPTFEPSARLGYILSPTWSAAVEHYTDFGPLNNLNCRTQQAQETFLVLDYTGAPVAVNFGVGHGWTQASNDWTFKFILDFSF